MDIECLNCRLPVHVEERNVGMSFSCDNCRAENFAFDDRPNPQKAVYYKVIKEDGETITYGQCNNEECDHQCVDILPLEFQGKIDKKDIKNQDVGLVFVDCPECGTPGRPRFKTTSPAN